MKRFAKTAVCLAGGLALNAGLRAADPAPANNPSANNPYATVAARNIFGLVPPPPPDDPAKDAEKNLPKITPTGIQSVFGQSQVLFKVAAGAAPRGRQPAKEEFYILSEGQRQDDIEVIKIDEKNSIVTFDNHGTTQELPLASAAESEAAAPSSPGPRNPGMPPGRPGGGGPAGPGGFTRFGAGSGGRGGGIGTGPPSFNGGNGNGANNGMELGGSTQGRTYQPMQDDPAPSAESQIIMMEYNRAIAQQKGDPQAILIPPTPLTQFNTPGDGSTPAAP